MRYTALAWRGALSKGLLRRFSGILTANAVNNVVSFVILIWSARAFGPELFGVLALAISITTLFWMLLDFGASVALVRLYNTETSPCERARLVREVLMLRVAILVLLVPLAFALERSATWLFPIVEGHEGLIYLAFFSSGLLSFWGTMRSIEQASRRFVSFQRYTLAYAALRSACAATVFLGGFSSITTVFVSLYTVPLAGLLILGWFTGYRSLLRRPAGSKDESPRKNLVPAALKRVFAYGAWVAVSTLCYTGLLRLPQFFLANTGNARETGLYSAALTFVAVFSLMNDALRTVILPDVSALKTTHTRDEFRRRFVRLGPTFFAVMILVLSVMVFAQYFVLGGNYRASIPIFLILGVAIIISVYLGVFNTLIHSYGVPRLDATNNLLRLAVLALFLWLVSPTVIVASLAFGAVLMAGELRVYSIIRRKDA